MKKVDATIEDLRKHVALDNDCNESDVFIHFRTESKWDLRFMYKW
ncbi:hypothetical protein [Chryseobacterium cucumeris]|nr:hypothetical protein [Chryseobacterium cucumeris]